MLGLGTCFEPTRCVKETDPRLCFPLLPRCRTRIPPSFVRSVRSIFSPLLFSPLLFSLPFPCLFLFLSFLSLGPADSRLLWCTPPFLPSFLPSPTGSTDCVNTSDHTRLPYQERLQHVQADLEVRACASFRSLAVWGAYTEYNTDTFRHRASLDSQLTATASLSSVAFSSVVRHDIHSS